MLTIRCLPRQRPALQDAHNSSLILRPALGNHPFAPISMHETRRAANESLIDFDVFPVAAYLVHAASL